MRLWLFDRVGAIASPPSDMNKDGQQFVLTILGFLWLDDKELGYDPSVVSLGGQKYIEIMHNGQREYLMLDKLIRRAPCIVGRAICWKAYRKGDQSQTPLVIKDSWQYREREEEENLLREATDKGVINVAKYYYHEAVQVNSKVDDIRHNIRKGLDVTKAATYRPLRSDTLPSASDTADTTQTGRTSGIRTRRKRSSSKTDAPLPQGSVRA